MEDGKAPLFTLNGNAAINEWISKQEA